MRAVTEPELIRSIFARPDIWPLVSDDFGGDVEKWSPAFGPDIHWLMPDQNDACFLLHAHRQTMWEAHLAVLPEARSRSLEYGRAVVQWMAAHTHCRCILAITTPANPSAQRFAEKMGFERIGPIPPSVSVGGVLLEQTINALRM